MTLQDVSSETLAQLARGPRVELADRAVRILRDRARFGDVDAQALLFRLDAEAIDAGEGLLR